MDPHKAAVIAALPQLEDRCASGRPSYKLQKNEKGICMVAMRDIERGSLVLFEEPLHVQPRNVSPSLLQQPEFAQCRATIARYATTHGHLSGKDAYPSEAQHALDRLTELSATEHMKASPHLREIWQLQDSHRCAEKGDIVLIDGLQSQAGKKLNGMEGEVVGLDETDHNRLAVEISMGKTSQKYRKSIKRSNLKTLGGIMRTNCFGGIDGTALLYKHTCRINHACGKAANVWRMEHNHKAYIFAKKEIHPGDEILIDYLPTDAGGEDRLGYLHMKYNFWCDCPEHAPEEAK